MTMTRQYRLFILSGSIAIACCSILAAGHPVANDTHHVIDLKHHQLNTTHHHINSTHDTGNDTHRSHNRRPNGSMNLGRDLSDVSSLAGDGSTISVNEAVQILKTRGVLAINHKFQHYMALGDSYSAGPGGEVGDNDTAGNGNLPDYGFCFNRDKAWPIVLSHQLNPTTFSFNACTGMTTQQIQQSQVDEDPYFGRPDLVTLTSGGNDGNSFANVVMSCPAWVKHAVGGTCDDALSLAERLLGSADFSRGLASLVTAILNKNPVPKRILVIMGYPHLYNDQILSPGFGANCWLSRARRLRINTLVDTLNGVLQTVANDNKDTPNGAVVFANPQFPAGAGRNTDKGDAVSEGHRFCETWNRAYFQGLPTKSDNQVNPAMKDVLKGLFHPNTAGHLVMEQTAQNGLAGLVGTYFPSPSAGPSV